MSVSRVPELTLRIINYYYFFVLLLFAFVSALVNNTLYFYTTGVVFSRFLSYKSYFG